MSYIQPFSQLAMDSDVDTSRWEYAGIEGLRKLIKYHAREPLLVCGPHDA